MQLCLVVKNSYLIQEHHRHHRQPPYRLSDMMLLHLLRLSRVVGEASSGKLSGKQLTKAS